MRTFLLVIAIVLFQQISGQTNFFEGNIIIYRDEISFGTLGGLGTAQFLDEYDGTDAPGYDVVPTTSATNLATASTNTAFKGIAFAPFLRSALPLNFIHFTAKNSANQALLNWEMAAADNCKYFIIERSTNGKDFDSITYINAARNKTVYGYRETYLNEGLAYYRIVGVEESGEKTYSCSTQFVQFKVNQNFVAYPNPIINEELTISLAEYGVKDITILNSFGHPVKTAYFCNTSTKINLGQLPKGMYYIQLKINNVIQPIKTVIIP